MDSAIKKLLSMLKPEKKSTGSDYTATVTRVEGNTAYVQMTGADINDTPVALTINASVGDKVRVRVNNGKAWIMGNDDAPPTDNTYARNVNTYLSKQIGYTNGNVSALGKIVQTVQKIAGNTNQYFWHTETGTDTGAHITEIPQEDFVADPANGGGNLLARSNGVAVRDGLTELAQFSASGANFNANGKSVSITTGDAQYAGRPSMRATDDIVVEALSGGEDGDIGRAIITSDPAVVFAEATRFEDPDYSDGYNVNCGIKVNAVGGDLYFRIAGQVYDNGSNSLRLETNLNLSVTGNISASGTVTQSSDKRLKEHKSYLDDDAVEFIRKLKPAHYTKDGEEHVGFYAQDVQKADPWNCMTGEMNGYMTLGYTEIIAPLVRYCQSLEERIKQLENK